MRGKDGSSWHVDQSYNLYKPHNIFSPYCLPNTIDLKEIVELFEYFMCQEIIDKIVISTNKRMNNSKMLSSIELKAFCGLLLLFGVTKKNDIEVNEIYCKKSVNYLEWAAVCMPRDRFKDICKNICFDDIDTRKIRFRNNPKFHKMVEVFEIFKDNLRNGLVPGSKTCIDEQLYSYRGRCQFKQYIPSKPAKYGIKYWSFIDVESGYLIDTNVYLGIFKIPFLFNLVKNLKIFLFSSL